MKRVHNMQRRDEGTSAVASIGTALLAMMGGLARNADDVARGVLRNADDVGRGVLRQADDFGRITTASGDDMLRHLDDSLTRMRVEHQSLDDLAHSTDALPRVTFEMLRHSANTGEVIVEVADDQDN
ncbi:MAG: hypothetical protein GY722_22600 [bacterium]|nr:hypothetical protein [bacterium]